MGDIDYIWPCVLPLDARPTAVRLAAFWGMSPMPCRRIGPRTPIRTTRHGCLKTDCTLAGRSWRPTNHNGRPMTAKELIPHMAGECINAVGRASNSKRMRPETIRKAPPAERPCQRLRQPPHPSPAGRPRRGLDNRSAGLLASGLPVNRLRLRAGIEPAWGRIPIGYSVWGSGTRSPSTPPKPL